VPTSLRLAEDCVRGCNVVLGFVVVVVVVSVDSSFVDIGGGD